MSCAIFRSEAKVILLIQADQADGIFRSGERVRKGILPIRTETTFVFLVMNVMALSFELLRTIILWAIRRYFVLNLAFLFGIRTGFIVIMSCTALIKVIIYFNLSLLWKMLLWAFAFLTLPLRLLTAIRRERQLETQMQYMKSELESIFWDRKALQRSLKSAIREHKMMELILADLEAEHDKAVAKIELLQEELQELRKENRRLTKIQGKDYWQFTSHDRTGVDVQDLVMHANEWADESKSTAGQFLTLLATRAGPVHPGQAQMIEQRREAAIGESLFSAALSLLVGVVVWQAQGPCMPLVSALLAVVTISLRSVFRFFSTVRTKPTTDAALLLSLNCFILGSLTYPMVPGAARGVIRLFERAASLVL